MASTTGATPPERPVDALVAAVATLWPGARARLSATRRPTPGARAEFLVVPDARRPRLLVPLAPPSAAARAMLRFSAATSVRESAGRIAIASALRAGGAPIFGDRVVVTGEDRESLVDHLGTLLGRPVTVSIGVGSARVNRKPVLQVFDADGRTAAFAKIGDSAVSRADVAAEAAALARVGSVDWQRIVAPTVLHHGTWQDLSLLVISPLPTGPRQHPRRQWQLPVEAMHELSGAFAAPAEPLKQLPWLARQFDLARGLRDRGAGDRMLACLDRLVGEMGDRQVPVSAWHGDWTPWNMARGGSRILLWDWERFEEGVPSGLDPCHYAVNATTRRDGTTPATIVAGLDLAGVSRGAPGSSTRLQGALYLIAVLGRYLPLIEVEGGEAIAARAEHALVALTTWLGRP